MGSKPILTLAWLVMGLAFATHAYGLWELEQNKTLKFVPNDISDHCVQCICQVEGCEKQIGKCKMDVGSLSCGPFQIKEPYWQDCGKPGSDWKSCTTQMDCSVTCVHQYMKRYGSRCSGKTSPSCQDYARIHNGGPKGCHNPATLKYWDKVNKCCQSKYQGNC